MVYSGEVPRNERPEPRWTFDGRPATFTHGGGPPIRRFGLPGGDEVRFHNPLPQPDYTPLEQRIAERVSRESITSEFAAVAQSFRAVNNAFGTSLAGVNQTMNAISQVTERMSRAAAKIANFALAYGMDAQKYQAYYPTLWDLLLEDPFCDPSKPFRRWVPFIRHKAKPKTRRGRRKMKKAQKPTFWQLLASDSFCLE